MESAVHPNWHVPWHLGTLTAPGGAGTRWVAGRRRWADSGGPANHRADGTAARLWRTGGGPSQPGARSCRWARRGTAWCGSFGFGRERATQRSGVARALETKFLRFDTGQERDGVLSLFAFGWLFPPWGWFWSPPSRRSRRSRCRGSVCCRRFLCGPSRAVGSSQAWGVTLRALPGRTMSGRFPAPTCPAFVPRP